MTPDPRRLASVVSNVGARAWEAERRPVGRRVLRYGDRIFVDLADATRRVVEVSNEAWRVFPPPEGVYFHRPPSMAALPQPDPGGTLEPLWELLSYIPTDRCVLVLAWLVGALRDMPSLSEVHRHWTTCRSCPTGSRMGWRPCPPAAR